MKETEEKDDKKYQLFLKQKKMLELFLEKGAISKEQFKKSYYDMKEKMGFEIGE